MKYIFLFFYLSSSLLAQTKPSFDCGKATTKIEKTICNDQELADYDNLLSETFNLKKADSSFKNAYLSWLNERNQCNKANESVVFCLRKKYVFIFDLILNKYSGFSKPFIPNAECFRPFLPQMNGDQGFYSTRVISEIRGCGNLNLNLEGANDSKYEVKFVDRKGTTYFYEIIEKHEKEVYNYTLGVYFEAKQIKDEKGASPTLIMSISETYEGLKKLN